MTATGVRIVVFLLAIIAIAPPAAVSDSIESEKVAKIKSAYLLNFLRFTDWPAHVFDDQKSPVKICILGEDSLGQILDGTVQNQAVAGRSIEIVRMTVPHNADKTTNETFARMRRCHLVFIGTSEAPRLRTILGSLHGTDTLTVGETASFAASGTMLALNLESDHIIFYANPTAIRAGNVDLSSKILQLARIVDPDDQIDED